MVFQQCGPTCPPTCDSDDVQCPSTDCSERCFCPTELVLSEGQCIDESNCEGTYSKYKDVVLTA